MITFSDPRYALQWHFGLIGDIETIWQEVSGAGVAVGVYDDGMDQDHPDLAANYDASLHYIGIGRDDGTHNTPYDGHGTSVGGLIAAALNGVGGVGVAWGASLTAVDYLNDIQNASEAVLYDSLVWTAQFDIVNQSYGVTPEFSDDWDIGDPGSYGWEEAQRFAQATQTGRGGLGTIFVKAAGNEANDPTLQSFGVLGNAQGEGHNVLHTVITVGAVGRDGSVESYSNYGANLLVSAPAATHTTDVAGSDGYAPGDNTNDFGGTSAAAPVVSGVVALMLETEPGLGWRDVQAILSLTAAQTGSAYGGPASGFEAGAWQDMGGETWNGGAMSYNPSYGFGLVDAFAAVRLAEVWLEVQGGAAATSGNLVQASFARSQTQSIFDNSDAELVLEVDQGIVIEHVYVTVEITHGFASDLTITLIAPDGTEVILAEGDGGGTDLSGDWTFGVAALRGMSATGDWTLRVSDGSGGDIGTLRSVEMTFLGSPESDYNVMVFTDDFPELAAADPSRRVVHGSYGGDDWIVTAAVADPVQITLGTSARLHVAGQQWAQFTGDVLNAASGDGDDVLTGAGEANVLRAGRGHDLVTGGGGSDDLAGGPDGDVLQGDGAGIYHTAISAQVYRLYLAVFGREPEVNGHQAWAQRMTLEQMTHDRVAQAFIASPEFTATYGATTDAEFVTLLYQNVLHRAPDDAGLASWVTRLEEGTSRARVVLLFAESPEHQIKSAVAQDAYDATHDITTRADDLYRLYQAILDRDPDLAGYEGWAEALAAGTRSFDQVVASFMGSPEFVDTYGRATSNTAFVTLLYENVLDRPPDTAGLNGWVTRLEDGMSRVKLVVFFLDSPEFIQSTAAGLADFMTRYNLGDTLRADGGDDVLAGGLYADQFVFTADGEASSITVTDLEPWDVLSFDGFGMDAGQIFAALEQDGDDVVLRAAGEAVIFADTALDEITQGMISIA